MARPEVVTTTCKSALNRVDGMPFRWSLNPYRGCAHGCHYCYARATHTYLGLGVGDDFRDRLFAKENVADVLRRELARPSWKGERVAIGTATDAYQPVEGRLRLTRQCLKVFLGAANPIWVTTKSTLVLRDLDLLRELTNVAHVKVSFTITTLDLTLWRLIEPGTPPPSQRLAALRRLRDAGIAAGVNLAPILPGITDSAESIEAVAAAAAEHGAVSLWVAPLRLAPLIKEHYFDFVERSFPHLAGRYARSYPRQDAPDDYLARLTERTAGILATYGFSDRRDPETTAESPTPSAPALAQLRLPV